MNAGRRARALAVIPYGMALRNLVFCKTLWDELVTEFDLDVVTPIQIPDPRAFGISRLYSDSSGSSLGRAADAVRRRAAGALMEIDKVDFFMRANEAETLRSIYRYASVDGREARMLFWSWLGRSPLRRPLVALCSALSARTEGGPDLRAYRFVLVAHNAEPRCVAYARAANRLGVPVVCVPMGLDNLMHGPLAFVPDLFLAWGEEQLRDLDVQTRWAPALHATVSAAIGSPSHDAYVRGGRGPDVERLYGLSARDKLILFPAYVERYGPFQRSICRLVVEFISSRGLAGKVLVRTRPGFDHDVWLRFQREHAEHVVLQMPAAASYDKSGRIPVFDEKRERDEIDLFAATLRRCDVVVTPTFSTVEMDAMVFEKPVVNAIFVPDRPNELHPLLPWYWAGVAKMPMWREMQVVTNADALRSALERIVVRGEAPSADGIFRFRATARDGRAGERAVAALRTFLRRARAA